MLNAITSRSILTDIVAPLRRQTPASFNAALDKANTADISSSNTTTISDKAKSMSARPAAPQFGSGYFENLATMSPDDRKAQVKNDADAISASQGLPSGQYNFKSLTAGQLEVVIGNMKTNLGASLESTIALGNQNARMSYDDFTPHDMTAGLAESAAFEESSGNAAGEALVESSLAVIAKFSAKVAAPDATKIYQSLSARYSESR